MLAAVCDDDPIFREEIKQMINDYAGEKQTDIDICEFDDGRALLASRDAFDIVFIDYLMPGPDGLETAREMRKRRYECSIIFVTAYPQFILDSFEVAPYRFFIKPVEKERLNAALDSYLALQRELAPVMIVDGGERHTVRTEDIIYIEAQGRNSMIRTRDRTYRCSKNLSRIEELLPKKCFFRVHRSYIINMYCISSLRRNEIIMINGEKALVSRAVLPAFRRAYSEFIKSYEL